MKPAINQQRLWDNMMSMAEIGATPQGGVSRLSLSPEDRKARNLLADWAKPCIDEMHVDEVGNQFLIRHGNSDKAPLILVGSHMDTQAHGGRFDGVYGVLAGLEALQTMHENNIRTDHGIAVVNWTNEEEARFCPAMGSAVFAGKLPLEQALACQDSQGKIFAEELQAIGYAGRRREFDFSAYYEIHIEQGPVLENEGKDIGVVLAAQGQIALDVTLTGEAGHSGTVPMQYRHDALCCAAEIITFCRQEVVDEGQGVFTSGTMMVKPGSRTTIPAEASFGIDLRHPDPTAINRLHQRLENIIKETALKHGCSPVIEVLSQRSTVEFHAGCVKKITDACIQSPYSYKEMVSGAMHDAVFIADLMPAGLIFVPCRNGISHNPAEYSSPEQLAKGATVLMHTVLSGI